MDEKIRAPRNRTLTVVEDEIPRLNERLVTLTRAASLAQIENRTIHQDLFACLPYLPDGFVDLLLIDPPYNLTKVYNSHKFRQTSDQDYEQWVQSWLNQLLRLLKPTASIYVCCDWKSSPVIYGALSKDFIVRNRITWEREKGRGAKTNWKNCSEDIWFATVSEDYYFDAEAVKLKRKVIAPYRDGAGNPKDWDEDQDGNYRLTHPSNLWTDITVPFWSMPENTDHPTQKPEKLLAKMILASSRTGDLVFDPFLGSGTTSVVAKKLNRRFVGVEIDRTYCLLAEKRLQLADADPSIQGYADGVFWERNSLNEQKLEQQRKSAKPAVKDLRTLF